MCIAIKDKHYYSNYNLDLIAGDGAEFEGTSSRCSCQDEIESVVAMVEVVLKSSVFNAMEITNEPEY